MVYNATIFVKQVHDISLVYPTVAQLDVEFFTRTDAFSLRVLDLILCVKTLSVPCAHSTKDNDAIFDLLESILVDTICCINPITLII
jgi:hypothetical protein